MNTRPYRGPWCVIRSDPSEPEDHLYRQVDTEAEARALVRKMNALALKREGNPLRTGRPVTLYFCVKAENGRAYACMASDCRASEEAAP